MKNWLLFLFISAISILNGWAQVSNSRGSFYLQEQQLGQAKSWFMDQLSKSPDDVTALVGLGNTYLVLNKADSARIIFQKAISLNPKNPFAIAGLGKVALLNKDRMASTDYFDRARRADKTNPEVYCDIVEGCLNLPRRDTVSALVYLNQGFSVNPKYAGLHLLTGDLEILKKNFGAATNAYDRAVFFDPRSAKAWRNLGYVNTISRSFRDAEIAFDKSIAIDPGRILVYKYLGDLFYVTARYPQGVKAYETYLSKAEATADDLERYALLLFFNKKYHEASEQLEKVIAINRDESILIRIKGYIACETGDYKNGLEYMDKFFMLHDPKKLIATDYIYYARLLLENGKEFAAIESYRNALALDPSKTELYEELAKLSSKNKRHSEAAGYYKKMAETGSDKVVSSFQTGKEYFFEGESWKSKYDSIRNIQKTGKNRFADSLALKKNMINYYSLADSAFSVVTRLSPDYAGGFIWKGRMQTLLDPEAENDGARNAYEKALLILLKGDPTKNRKMIIECYKYMGSWYYLAYEKYEKSDKQLSAEMRSKSVEFFTRISELDPSDAQAKAVLAKIKGKNL